MKTAVILMNLKIRYLLIDLQVHLSDSAFVLMTDLNYESLSSNVHAPPDALTS